MSTVHTVRAGESVASLAEESGHFPGTIWEHGENEALRTRRANMNILAEGDAVFIPDLRPKMLDAATGARHRYRRRGVPAVFRLQLLRDGKPRADLRYRLEIDGAEVDGVTDARGVLEVFVPPSVHEILLYLGDATRPRVLKIGRLEPADSLKGVQQRLLNLGHACAVTGALDDATHTALRGFQRVAEIPITGEPDAATLAALRTAHDEIGGAR